ncbi:MAG: L-lactate permease [Verrucomicrobiota bacterium]|jgi:lactate permease
MWEQDIIPLRGPLGFSALVAALPIIFVLFLLGVRRTPAWVAAVSGLGVASVVARLVYGMPVGTMIAAMSYGAAFGLFPIAWILFWAIMLHRLALETGHFEVLKDSIGGLTHDRRLQALLIAFAFGAFLEGAAGFGAPVAIAAAMLTGLGFSRFYAAGICLLANTAPVAFGSIGIPIITLAGVTGLPVRDLSSWAGRICAPVSVFIPAYLILVMGGLPALKGVLPAALLCGVVFAGVQFLVSNFLGPQLTDVLSSLAAMGSLIVLLKIWKPKDKGAYADERDIHTATRHSTGQVFMAWLPYLLLVLLVFLWGLDAVKEPLERVTMKFNWPGLQSAAQSVPPVARASSSFAGVYKLNFMTASGTACMFAMLLASIFLRVTPRQFGKVTAISIQQLAFPVLTIVSVLSFAFLMNYSGATTTLGLAFASTGRAFPFFSALLGWLGVFLVGSDTSSNALFGNLQAVTAGRLGLNPILMAAANSSGGVMGKMISLSSIAVAVAATGLPASDEAKLFRFTLKHSVILTTAIGLVVAIYAWLGQ